ncbi:pro-FMRFamide-related neuropeptide VF [Microcaecilia unicolor]|uniref:Pro-FMRFamide-related neuropeptide VF n=1 Tax=Microcaecilia unicolor TaxID=1415580 RepID=A0A6P7YDY0_9AMPH|nr:pro-FMRFamide-related neuropeptide VF [Microcaecilia unicolor]
MGMLQSSPGIAIRITAQNGQFVDHSSMPTSAARGFCFEDSSMFGLNGRRSSGEDHFEPGAILDDKQRSLTSEELKDWAPKDIIKMSIPVVNKIANSVANLPLRFGRAFQEDRSTKSLANLPLRFGRALEERICKSVPNLPQRFGRSLFTKYSIQPLANLPQRFGRSPLNGQFIQPLANLPQRFGRTLDLNNDADGEDKDMMANQNMWSQYSTHMTME